MPKHRPNPLERMQNKWT